MAGKNHSIPKLSLIISSFGLCFESSLTLKFPIICCSDITPLESTTNLFWRIIANWLFKYFLMRILHLDGTDFGEVRFIFRPSNKHTWNQLFSWEQHEKHSLTPSEEVEDADVIITSEQHFDIFWVMRWRSRHETTGWVETLNSQSEARSKISQHYHEQQQGITCGGFSSKHVIRSLLVCPCSPHLCNRSNSHWETERAMTYIVCKWPISIRNLVQFN